MHSTLVKSFVKIITIIPARMDSVRLPGKPLRDIDQQPLLKRVVDRCRRIERSELVVIATTNRPVDAPIIEFARGSGVEVFAGELDNVTERFLSCAQFFGADYFVRANGDSPFLDPELISRGFVALHDDLPDLVTNLVGRTFPYGISVEIVSVSALEAVCQRDLEEDEAEHVTAFFYKNPTAFRIKFLTSERPELKVARLTVDTELDLRLSERIFERLGSEWLNCGFEKICEAYFAESGRLV